MENAEHAKLAAEISEIKGKLMQVCEELDTTLVDLQTEQKNSMCCLLVTFRAILMFQEGCI
jgi:hypothetical protein